MSHKNLLSLSLFVVVLQACGDTPDEKKLKRQNEELRRQNEQSAQLHAEAIEVLENAQKQRAEAEAARLGLETELAGRQEAVASLQGQLKTKDTIIIAKEAEIVDLLGFAAAAKAELEAQLAARVAVINERDLEIARLTAKLEELSASPDLANARAEIARLTAKLEELSASSDLTSARTEIAQLKEERELMKTSLAQAEVAASASSKQLEAANSRVSDLENRLAGILQKSLADVQGLWMNQDKVSSIPGAACYEFVHLAVNGNFAQAIACQDGRVQLQKHSFDHFAAQGVAEQRNNDYMGVYGFAIDGLASSSTCQDAGSSLLKAGDRLVFEMTRQDFDRDYGNLISRNMLVSQGQGFKGYINASLHFVDNNLDYATMSAIAGSSAKPLSKAAAAFVGAVEGQSANIRLGCFDSNGIFTATSN